MTGSGNARWVHAPLVLLTLLGGGAYTESAPPALTLSWEREILSIRGKHLPGGELPVWYIEAFCRPGSTRRDWKETVIPHRTRLVEAAPDGRRIRLRSELDDGVEVDHEIHAGDDEVDFRVVATNPRKAESQAHWAQPCIRVDRFTGTSAIRASEDYLPSCFIFVNGKLAPLPTAPWAREALYTPGQVWCPEGVNRDDVNPRPLSSIVPSNGLIGCFSADRKQIIATAWEPYQELFQGVIVCLHSDFRIGGLAPGQTRTIRGKIYLVPADVEALLARYRRDFPEQARTASRGGTRARPRKLIEFGWDEPDTAFLRRNQAVIERTPFDGCVFHVMASARGRKPENFTWLCWGRRRFAADELSGALDDLRSISWSRFRDNFLRFNVTPADLDWFDDHGPVTANARLAAKLAREGHARGILLDTEQYNGRLFDYKAQRDAASKPWPEYAAQARLRGKEIMAAFQEAFPDLALFATFGPSLLWSKSREGRRPLSDCEYGLLVPFFDGLIEGIRGETRIVDGYERSYGFRQEGQFEEGREITAIRTAALMADPAAYLRTVSPAFGLWLDYNWPKLGWRTDRPESNYFTPEGFRTSLAAALERSDDYVWVYTERPRWWTAEGNRVDLPEAYVREIRRVREEYCRD
jgi:hypothetical protein